MLAFAMKLLQAICSQVACKWMDQLVVLPVFFTKSHHTLTMNLSMLIQEKPELALFFSLQHFISVLITPLKNKCNDWLAFLS